MKPIQYLVCVPLGSVVLGLSVALFVTGKSAQGVQLEIGKLQLDISAQQDEISKGQASLQISQRLLLENCAARKSIWSARMRRELISARYSALLGR